MNQRAAINEVEQANDGLSLAWQFVLTAFVVLLLGMGVIGLWVSDRIAAAVTRNTAVATALYVDSVISPLTLELGESSSLSEGPTLALRETLGNGVLGERLAAFKLWLPNGTVIFSTDESILGKRFPLSEGLQSALSGKVHGELNSLDEVENSNERRSGRELLEIYSPIREPWSGRIIGVAEFYEAADELGTDIANAKLRSWLVVGAVTVAMIALLFVIVARGSRLIKRQREALRGKVAELLRLLRQNEALRNRARAASDRTSTLNEQYLRRISADLHDGPGQLLAFALLRLNSATAALPTSEDLRAVRSSLEEALSEVRNISRGAALPELDKLDTIEVIRRVTKAHEARSGTVVKIFIDGRLPSLGHAEKICIYRFVQEALSNATRHASGKGQIVRGAFVDGEIRVVVSDSGAGFDPVRAFRGLGLLGLEERLAGLGGDFEVRSQPGSGTTLTMRLPVEISDGGME